MQRQTPVHDAADALRSASGAEKDRGAHATAVFIEDFLHASHAPDFPALGRALRERDAELCRDQPQPAQVLMAHIMRALGTAGVSVTAGAHVLAAYLAEERGSFSEARMFAGLAAIGVDMQGAPTFGDAVRQAGAAHNRKDPFLWVAAALRIWLDVPQALAGVTEREA